MPTLDTKLHLTMLDRGRANKPSELYGLHWGDPDKLPHLNMVRRHYLDFYIFPETTALEIGPGGGRWTRYMLKARRLYAVDYHQELLDELARHINPPNLIPIKNNGTDFPGVPDASVDFIFSFGVFVHLENEIIAGYLKNMRRVLKPGANVVIQYADKTKPLAQRNTGFGNNTPEKMLRMVRDAGYSVQDDNRWLLSHSSIVRFIPQEPR